MTRREFMTALGTGTTAAVLAAACSPASLADGCAFRTKGEVPSPAMQRMDVDGKKEEDGGVKGKSLEEPVVQIETHSEVDEKEKEDAGVSSSPSEKLKKDSERISQQKPKVFPPKKLGGKPMNPSLDINQTVPAKNLTKY